MIDNYNLVSFYDEVEKGKIMLLNQAYRDMYLPLKLNDENRLINSISQNMVDWQALLKAIGSKDHLEYDIDKLLISIQYHKDSLLAHFGKRFHDKHIELKKIEEKIHKRNMRKRFSIVR